MARRRSPLLPPGSPRSRPNSPFPQPRRGLGTTAGPGIIAALAVMGTIAPLYFVAAVGAVSAFSIWRFLPERTAPVMHQRDKSSKLSWRDGRILPFLIFGVLLGTAGSFPIQVIAYFFMDVLKLETNEAIQLSGVGLMASSMAALFAQLVIVQRMQQIGNRLQIGLARSVASGELVCHYAIGDDRALFYAKVFRTNDVRMHGDRRKIHHHRVDIGARAVEADALSGEPIEERGLAW